MFHRRSESAMRSSTTHSRLGPGAAILIPAVAALLTGCGQPAAGGSSTSGADTPEFSDPAHITNPFLPVSDLPDCTLVGTGEDTGALVVRHVLDRTEPFEVEGQTVDAMVVEDTESDQGERVERTLDYFAQDDAGTVYYLGEDVDTYEKGKVTGHGGSWRYGKDTDELGVLMPADPQVGDEWMSENVPGVTRESDQAVDPPKSATAQGKTYTDLLKVRERALPDKETEFKLYSRGTGVISEENGALELKSCS
jgi:hypothetical protein